MVDGQTVRNRRNPAHTSSIAAIQPLLDLSSEFSILNSMPYPYADRCRSGKV